MASPITEYRTWHWPDNQLYICSTDPAYLQPEAINAALGSEMLWWTKSLDKENLEKMLDNCLCLGLYRKPSSLEVSGSGEETVQMIGMARVITDRVTFGYLTDVYVLQEYQGQGLGRWLMSCLDDILAEWRSLRGFWLLAGNAEAARLYETSLGVKQMGTVPVGANGLLLLAHIGPRDQAKTETSQIALSS